VGKSLLVQVATKMKALNEETYEEVANSVLSSLRSSTGAYDESDYILRDHLFGIYVSWGQCSDAAQTLSGVNVDSSTKVLNEQEKADLYIKCAEAFLQEDASVDAEVFVNKASPFVNAVTDTTIVLRYRVTFARVMDSNRKFVEAALRYYELSTTNHPGVRFCNFNSPNAF
jgi:COP9 signalosome complex subunit 4